MSAPALRSSTAVRLAASRVVRAHAGTGFVAAVTFVIAFDGGSYSLPDRATLAIGAWWLVILSVVLALAPRVQLSRAAAIAGAGLSGFALWTVLSAVWAPSVENVLLEFNRTSLYLAIFVLTLLGASRLPLERWLDGLALSASAVAVGALATRLVPEIAPERSLPAAVPSEVTRLSFPLDYWNGTALYLAIGLPLVLRSAIEARSTQWRAAAIAAVPAIGAVVYLTASRGGALVGMLAAGLFVALAADRVRAAAAVLVAVAGTAGTVGALLAFPDVVDARFDVSGVDTQAHLLAVLLPAVCALTGGGWILAERVLGRVRLSTQVLRVLLGTALVVFVVGVAVSDPGGRLRALTDVPSGEAPVGADPARAHLLSGGGSGRWQFWGAAVDEFRSAPLHGQGAGAFESWWGEHPKFQYFVRDAHSLYLETLGDLGLVGLALLLLALGAGVAAGVRLLRRGVRRTAVAALFAAYIAYLLAVAIDWMWELTAVTVVGIVLLALLTGTSREDTEPRVQDPTPRFGLGLGALAVAWILLCVQAIPLLAEFKIRDSQTAAAAGGIAEAAKSARAAQSLEPWASSPYVQLALVAEEANDLPEARRWIGEALERDSRDWRLWLVSARLEAKAGAIADARRSLARAEDLSPRRLTGGPS